MKITGEYCKELVDGKFVIEMDLIEFELLDCLLGLATTSIMSGCAHNEPFHHEVLESFAFEIQDKKDGLICDEIDKASLINRMVNEPAISRAN